jgi:cytochrome b561
MQRTNGTAASRSFDPVIKLLHWLTLLLLTAIFVLAFSFDHVASRQQEAILVQFHRSFGVIVWVVTVGRLVWRQFTRFPDWPANMSRAMRRAAHATEYALYALLLIQPVLGLIHTNAHGDRVNLFFLGYLPALTGPDRAFAHQILILHRTVGCVLLGLIGLHAAAALYHHLWRRDSTLVRMLPQGMDRAGAMQQDALRGAD